MISKSESSRVEKLRLHVPFWCKRHTCALTCFGRGAELSLQQIQKSLRCRAETGPSNNNRNVKIFTMAKTKDRSKPNGKAKAVKAQAEAPKPKAAVPSSDFILTISDSDEDVPNLDSEDEANDSDAPEPAPAPKSKKRKRTDEEESDRKKNNTDINPDFEFMNAGTDAIVTEEGWGFEGVVGRSEKKGVNLDDIIARNKEEDEDDIKEEDDEEDEGAEADSEEDDEEGGISLDFDDEVDGEGFGMGADSEDEEDGDDSAAEDDEDGEEEGGSDEGEDSDAESVASVVPHPMDLESDQGSDVESEGEKARKAAYFAPEEETTKETKATTSFTTMNLSRPIMKGLSNIGFSAPTPIQAKTIPVALLGKDIVGGAVTGSGKTAAFIVPILERLLYRPKKTPTSRVVILCPTRELAMQCHSVGLKLSAFTDIKFCLCVGGLSLKSQEAELRLRPDVIIGTPGRFIDHMRNSPSFSVEGIEILVLDEADRMLEDGFADELNEIINTIPKSRQTMLFSATMTDSVDKLIRLSLNRPVRLMIDAKSSTAAGLVQEFIRIRPQNVDKRLAMLVHLCKTLYTDRVIIFLRSKAFAHRLRIIFGLLGIKAAELHGSLSQEQRIQAVESFRTGVSPFLLATDLASRGLDIKNVETVINYETPQSLEIYLHRVGRTARAGRTGRAITLASESDRKIVKAAVKSAQEKGSKVVSRSLDLDEVSKLAEKIAKLDPKIEKILEEEKEERQLATADMQIRKSENLINHADEIASRPKRTWFETNEQRAEAKNKGAVELNGAPLKKTGKLSNKKRKQMEDKETIQGERMYKKTKVDRTAPNGKATGKSAKKNAIKGKPKGKPKGKGGKRH